MNERNKITFEFTENQLASMLHGTIELYVQYRIAGSADEPARKTAIYEVLQFLKVDSQLDELGIVDCSLQTIARKGEMVNDD